MLLVAQLFAADFEPTKLDLDTLLAQNYAPQPYQQYQQGQYAQPQYPYQQPQQPAPQYHQQGQYAPQQAPQQQYAPPPQNYYPQQGQQQYYPNAQQPQQYQAQPQYAPQQPPQYAPQPEPQQQYAPTPQQYTQPQYEPQQPAQQPRYAPQQAPQPTQYAAQRTHYNPTARQSDKIFFGFGVLGGNNATTFNNTDFKPDDLGLYLRFGKQYSIARTHLSYSFIKHFGDDDNWVKNGDKSYHANSFLVSFGVDLMPKFPSSPLYGILGVDAGLEIMGLKYENRSSNLQAGELEKLSKTIFGANLGLNAGIAIEITQTFQIELAARYGISILQKIDSKYETEQSNLTGRVGLNITF